MASLCSCARHVALADMSHVMAAAAKAPDVLAAAPDVLAAAAKALDVLAAAEKVLAAAEKATNVLAAENHAKANAIRTTIKAQDETITSWTMLAGVVAGFALMSGATAWGRHDIDPALWLQFGGSSYGSMVLAGAWQQWYYARKQSNFALDPAKKQQGNVWVRRPGIDSSFAVLIGSGVQGDGYPIQDGHPLAHVLVGYLRFTGTWVRLHDAPEPEEER